MYVIKLAKQFINTQRNYGKQLIQLSTRITIITLRNMKTQIFKNKNLNP